MFHFILHKNGILPRTDNNNYFSALFFVHYYYFMRLLKQHLRWLTPLRVVLCLTFFVAGYFLSIFFCMFLDVKLNFFYIVYAISAVYKSGSILSHIGYVLGHVLYYVSWVIVPLVYLLCIILAIAFLTLLERQILSVIQHRQGPNVVGFLGVGQPLADAFKLLFKEVILPLKANKLLFISSSFLMLILALLCWLVLPFNYGVVLADFSVGYLYLYSLLGLNLYGLIFSGWSSNSRYSFLGSLRACAQMLSYELIMGTIIITIFFFTGSLNFTEIVQNQIGSSTLVSEAPSIDDNISVLLDLLRTPGSNFLSGWYGIWSFPLFVLFFISCLAETNRPPFDFPEAESELVSGYNVEYSSMSFAFFFLAEYCFILVMSNLCVIMFLGGWSAPLGFLSFFPYWFWYCLKLWFMLFCFVWVRGTLPRYRYDQLMSLGWKVFLPFSLAYCLFLIGGVFCFC